MNEVNFKSNTYSMKKKWRIMMVGGWWLVDGNVLTEALKRVANE